MTPAKPWLFKIRRNPDGWLASARLTGRAIFYAPSSFWFMAGDGLAMAVMGLAMGLVGALIWALTTTAQVLCGFAGFLVEAPNVKVVEAGDAG